MNAKQDMPLRSILSTSHTDLWIWARSSAFWRRSQGSVALTKACSKRMARSAVIGASQAHTAESAASSICRCAATSPIVGHSASMQSS